MSVRSESTSRLYHLPLREAGSPNVGSLSDYLVRLAADHSVSVYDLVRHEVLPRLGFDYDNPTPRPYPNKLSTTWWKQLSLTLDGLNRSTRLWIDALHSLTLTSDLARTTSYNLAGSISSRCLIREYAAWCPFCFDEWTNDNKLYRPLRWSLQVVTSCLVHGVPLETRCPRCELTQLNISPQAKTGWCSSCQYPLNAVRQKTTLDENELQQQQWVINQVSGLIAAQPEERRNSNGEVFRREIRAFIDNELQGNAKALSRMLGLHHKTVYELRDGKQLPQLGTLLKFAAVLSKPAVWLLFGREVAGSSSYPIDALSLNVPIARPLKQSFNFSKQEVRQELHNIINNKEMLPLSMATVAKQLGFDQSFLRSHFLYETSIITGRYLAHTRNMAQKRKNKEFASVRRAVLNIHRNGLYPSHKRLRKLVGGACRSPIARQARSTALKELGYDT